MKKLKILLSIILITVLMLPISTVSALYFIDDNIEVNNKNLKNDGTWYYITDEQSKTATIYAYNGDDENVIIPEKIEGYTVNCLRLYSGIMSIGGCPTDFPVFDKKIKTLTIPKTLELIASKIEENKYYDPDEYDYENDILYHKDKKILNGYFCARGLENLEAINVADDNPYFSSVDGVLYNKNKTALISYPEGKKNEKYTVPNTVTTILDNAFWGMSLNLNEIVITENVTVLGEDNDIFNSRKTSIEKVTILNNILGKKQLSRMFSNDILDLTYIEDLGLKGIKVTVYKDSPAHKYYSERKNLIFLDNPYIENEEKKAENKKEESKAEKTESKDTSFKKEQSTENKSQKTESQNATSKQDDVVSKTESVESVENTDNTVSEDSATTDSEKQPTEKNNLPKIIIISVLALLVLGGGITLILLRRRKRI